MANRVTYSDVLLLITTSLTNDQVTSFITAAHTIIEEQFSDSGLASDTLDNIEAYLAAHLIAVTRERQTTEEKVGEVQVKYTGKFGEQLKMTSYGQMALVFDSTGTLAAMGKRKAKIRAIDNFDD